MYLTITKSSIIVPPLRLSFPSFIATTQYSCIFLSLGTGEVLSKINKKRENKNTQADSSNFVANSPVSEKDKTENSENQINDLFLVTDPIIRLLEITKMNSDDRSNRYENFKNKNKDRDQYKDEEREESRYGDGNGYSSKKRFVASDRDKWTWRPGKEITQSVSQSV